MCVYFGLIVKKMDPKFKKKNSISFVYVDIMTMSNDTVLLYEVYMRKQIQNKCVDPFIEWNKHNYTVLSELMQRQS